MKTLVLVVLLVALLAISPAVGYEWTQNPANGHWYAVVSTGGDYWDSAEGKAVATGGHLVTINDEAENEWVRSTFTLYYFHYMWIGLYEIDYTQRTWAWISGESITYTNWAYGEPSGPGAEHWVAMDGYGLWRDLSSPWPYPYTHIAVVEVVPEPSGLLALVGAVATLGMLKRRK